jgi:two-component system, cell cycle response regulator
MPLFTQRCDEIKAVSRLPSPPGLAAEIARVLGQSQIQFQDLLGIAQADPASAGRVLRRANFGWSGRPTASIPEAIRRLGVNTAWATILDFSTLERTAATATFDYHRFWLQSYARALTAHEFAIQSEIVCPDEAFGCALLARAGDLVLATVYPTECATRPAEAEGGGEISERTGSEKVHCGVAASQLTAALLREWQLPNFFIDAILSMAGSCSEPVNSSSRLKQFAGLLKAADEIAIRFDDVDSSVSLSTTIDQLGLRANDLVQIRRSVKSELQKCRGLFELFPDSTISTVAPRFDLREPVRVPEERSKPLQVLVAEDNVAQRKLITHVLMSAGHTVLACADGDTALKMALAHQPDVVLSDWQMPGMDGLELCSALRQSSVGRGVYFVLITGEGDDATLVKAFERGADDFVAKPLSPKVLQARMKAAQRLISVESQIREERAKLCKLTSDLADANRKLESASLTDFLTGLPNRRFFMQQMEQHWSASVRRNRDVACLLIDVDHFKLINDRYGHPMGDAVLKELAAIFLRHKRDEDIICRYGGEEFAILLPESDVEVAFLVAERLREATERETQSQLQVLAEPITVSVGLAVRTPQTESAADLLEDADQALYRAKRDGRNKTCIVSALEFSAPT